VNEASATVLLHALLFASARLFALFLTFGLLDAGNLKGLQRTAFVISLSLVVVPPMVVAMPPALDMVQIVALLAKEVAIGAFMGYFANQVFWAVQSVGSIIDQQSGIGMAAMIDPVNRNQEGPTPGFLTQVVTNLMLASGGFLALLGAVYESYAVWPVFSALPHMGDFIAQMATRQWSSLSEIVLRWCAPAIVMMMFVEIGLGLIQRFLTTLNVFFFSQSLKVVMAVFMLTLMLASSWDTLASTMNPQAMVRMLFKGKS
jgi:type III secretion protein T